MRRQNVDLEREAIKIVLKANGIEPTESIVNQLVLTVATLASERLSQRILEDVRKEFNGEQQYA